jgi:hypothetical protein
MIKDFFRKSYPTKSNIYGIEINKLPLGAYLDAIDSLKNLPDILLKNSFPGLKPDEVLDKFKTLNTDTLMELAGNLLVTVPEQALKFVSALIGVPYETLRNDPNIGLNGIKDILKEFWKVNDMQSFFADIGQALASSKITKMLNGSKN